MVISLSVKASKDHRIHNKVFLKLFTFNSSPTPSIYPLKSDQPRTTSARILFPALISFLFFLKINQKDHKGLTFPLFNNFCTETRQTNQFHKAYQLSEFFQPNIFEIESIRKRLQGQERRQTDKCGIVHWVPQRERIEAPKSGKFLAFRKSFCSAEKRIIFLCWFEA